MTRRCPWKKRSTPPPAAVPPASRRPTSFVRGEHEFHIVGYNARAALANNAHYSILSGAFKVGGHNWALDCSFHDDGHLASIALLLLTAYITDDAVVAKASLKIEDPLGRWPAAVWESDEAYTFHVWSGNSWQLSQAGRSWTLPVPEAFRGHESRYVQDDHLTILCTVEVLRAEEEEESAIAEDMQKLLFLLSEPKSTTPACMLPDVTFVVEQAEIQAHRLVLAMRSPVFAAELLGDMREGTTRHVMVEDMSASTFRAMLRFIYTDELPIKGKTTNERGCKQKCAARRRVDMALDLLVAADRYDLEKLRLMCEKILSESIDTASVIPTLMAVLGRHSCRQLEASCIEYLASDANVYANIKATEEYKELEDSCCSFLANVMDKVATSGVEDMTLAPPPNIVSHLEQLLVSEKGADVTFLVENKEIHAHSLVIATRSPALYTMVLATNQEEYIVPVWGMRVEVFKAVLRFIYTDELPPFEEIALAAGHGVTTIAQDMLVAASRFHLDRMKDKCETMVGECVSERNVVIMLRLACRHNCKKLEDYCMKFN
uniref:BTB containing protein n=1 Tax=Triticum aestivum TaxID=4565 RepID=A0A0B4SVI9_WHEAT|nr:BTB containing protein [Triticum aestivum]